MKTVIFLLIFFANGFAHGQLTSYSDQCEADKKRAIEDSKTKTIYFLNLPAPRSPDFLQGKELTEILLKDNIIFGGDWMGSDVSSIYTKEECYKVTMTNFAIQKFGENYFEQKIKDAFGLYLKNNLIKFSITYTIISTQTRL